MPKVIIRIAIDGDIPQIKLDQIKAWVRDNRSPQLTVFGKVITQVETDEPIDFNGD